MHRILQWRPGSYLRASGELFGWLLLRAFALAVMVLLLARLMGAEGYGVFVAVLAVVGFFTPLAGLGLGGLLLRDCAKEPETLPQSLGMALALWWPSALVFTLLAVLTTAWLLPLSIPFYVLAIFAFSEVVATSFIELAGRVEQSQYHVRTFGCLLAGLPVARLAGLLGYILLLPPDTTGWLWVYAVTSLAYTAAVAWRLMVRYRPVWPVRREWSMARESLPFTMGALSFRLQGEFNKPLLAQTSYGYAGNFSVAQRVVDLTNLPLQAMQEALWPRLYASDSPQRRLWTTGALLIALALFCGVIIFLSAPLLTYLLGGGYEGAVGMMRWLAWLPAIQVLRNVMNFRLTAPERTHLLTWVYVFTTITSVLLAVWLIPIYGMDGAAIAAYGNECALLLALTILPRMVKGGEK